MAPQQGANAMNEFNPQQPIHVGTLNGMPLRFYPPQTNDDLMPWAAMDDLAAALGMNRTARRALREANAKFPDLAKRIQTEGGMEVDVLGFQAVQGLMGALKQAGTAGDAVHMAFTEQVVAAAQKAYPLMFDRDANGELIVNSHMLSMLLGENHEATVARIRAEGIDAKRVRGPQRH
jgi:hypothetical protein